MNIILHLTTQLSLASALPSTEDYITLYLNRFHGESAIRSSPMCSTGVTLQLGKSPKTLLSRISRCKINGRNDR